MIEAYANSFLLFTFDTALNYFHCPLFFIPNQFYTHTHCCSFNSSPTLRTYIIWDPRRNSSTGCYFSLFKIPIFLHYLPFLSISSIRSINDHPLTMYFAYNEYFTFYLRISFINIYLILTWDTLLRHRIPMNITMRKISRRSCFYR